MKKLVLILYIGIFLSGCTIAPKENSTEITTIIVSQDNNKEDFLEDNYKNFENIKNLAKLAGVSKEKIIVLQEDENSLIYYFLKEGEKSEEIKK